MSPVAKAAIAILSGIAGLNNDNSSLTASSSRHGFAAVNFTDTTYNILPPLIGPGKVGVHILSAYDHSRPFHPHCGPGDVEIPEGLCSQPREIRVSMFYPACPALDSAKPDANEQYFAPVFEPSLVANISRLTLGDATAMHNVMSHAVKDALICQGEYNVVMFTPPANGQRQAYTQFASQLASLGHIAVTVDHPYLSGFVELQDGTVHASTIGDFISIFEAGFVQYDDIAFLEKILTNRFKLLPSRFRPADLASSICVFGHGLGGQVAQNLVANGVAACGGHLEGLVKLPYPLYEVDALAKQPPPIALPDPKQISLAPKKWAESLIKPTKELLAAIICRAKGTCNSTTDGNAIRKRSVGGDDCCHHEDWDYDDDRCDHYCDDVNFGDDGPDEFYDGRDDFYDDGRGYEEPQHNVDDVPPLPPLDKTRPDDSPWNWDADWIDYSDNIGNYPGRRHRFPTGPRYPTRPPPRPHARPQEPCYDDEGYLDQDCAESHGEVHDHHDDFPDYPHHGRHPSHGGVHEHHDEHPGYPHHGGHHSHPSHGGIREHYDDSHQNKGDDECGESCHGPVGHHHNDWKDVHEGYKWDDQDYDYEEDDDDDEGAENKAGCVEDDDEDKCADNDDDGADDGDDECADDGDEDECADDDDEGADDDDEGADDDDEGADDDDEGADDDDEGADDDDEGADDDDEGAEDDAEGAEDDAEGDDEENGCEDEDPCQ